ncbi:hypothetical protein DFO45_2310 [Azorhizobium sp. AG788]|uniref:hypothetical protein n=1 Tax=Azorhizobium sp. AG788 TaxID=2183897 RepID=UPI00105D1EAF|nr:hypothetical protein [Azorhizobium sp. AG788]TDT94560.1 hypothetical protein DFO45_2310 [Azorhizobium sp. AG788]
MMPRLSDAALRKAAQLMAKHGSERAAARAAGMSRSTFQHHVKRATERGFMGTKPVLPGFAIKKTSVRYGPDGTVRGETVEQRPAAGEPSEISAGQVLKGLSTLSDPEGRVILKWTKTREGMSPERMGEALREALAEHRAAAPVTHAPPAECEDDLLTVYALPDLHIGMLAWGRETGERYDLGIACDLVRSAVADLVAQSRPSRHAVVLGLGDYFHSNDRTAMTPKSGHILDVDGRWPKVLRADARVALDMVGQVSARLGRVLLGATHGHTMKPDRMAMMLAADRPEDWGATLFRHVFFGHIHHETAREVGAVRVESFQSPAAKDAHAHGGDWRAGRSLTAITFHRTRGEIGRHRVNLPIPSEAA